MYYLNHQTIVFLFGEMSILILPKKHQMARSLLIYIILSLIIVGLIASLSLVIRTKNQRIDHIESEIKGKNEQINRLHADLVDLKKEMEMDIRASETHVEKTTEAANEYIQKVEMVCADPDAVDWRDQRLPDAVVYSFTQRACKNTND